MISRQKMGLVLGPLLFSLIVRTIGTSPKKTIGGFMAATAFISAWINNTATAMMMVPIATAVINHVSKKGEDKNFNTAICSRLPMQPPLVGLPLLSAPHQILFSQEYTGRSMELR